MITDVPGVRVGHYTDEAGATGCTVVLLPPGTVGAYWLAGAAPGTRETDLLGPSNLVSEVHAFVVTGGSAFGLAAAHGVVEWLEERGVGYVFGPARVPIVPAAVIFDLAVGDPKARPGPADGRAAADAAGTHVEEGSVGAGTGASVGKWAGPGHALKGGLGTASAVVGPAVVGAIVVCNAAGDIHGEKGELVAGGGPEGAAWRLEAGQATVLAVVATNAKLDKAMATHVGRMAAAGIARTVRPAHTLGDGDIVFVAATGQVPDLSPSALGAAAADVVAAALLRGVRLAKGLGGVPGLAD